jgi:hypothetical protein
MQCSCAGIAALGLHPITPLKAMLPLMEAGLDSALGTGFQMSLNPKSAHDPI